MSSTVPSPLPRKTDPLIGCTIAGKYRILSVIASGGMGRVYRAEQTPLGRVVALKVMHLQGPNGESDDAEDTRGNKRFLREASILAKLQHPNIVTMFDYGAIEGDGDRFFMVMEFLSGTTLTRRISDCMVLGVHDTVKIARQIARGLTEAHGNGVIHRDLKPSNVMLVVGKDGEDLAKIVDFGIVKLVGDDSQDGESLTREGSFIGSPKYMAPEQITRGGKIDERTDIYSFGVILYQCLTGTVPFDGESSVQTLMAHLNQPVPRMSERVPGLEVPEWLEQLVMACLEKEPERRPQTMVSVARTLGEAEAQLASGRTMGAIPAQGGLSPRADSGPSAAGSARQTSISTQATSSSVVPAKSNPGRTGEEPTRTSPGMESRKPARRSPAHFAMGALVVLTVAGGIAVALFPRQTRERHEESAEATRPAASITSLAAVAPSAQRHDDFGLTIESIPSGAYVREGERVLGMTPLLLTIDNDSVRTTPRAFTVARDGFEPYALAQGSSQSNVRLLAPLIAMVDAGARSPARRELPPRAATTAGSPAPSASADLDIRLTR